MRPRRCPPISEPTNRRSPGTAPADSGQPRADAVQEMRRRLEELLSGSGSPDGVRSRGQDSELVRRAEGGSVAPDTMGTRPDASDPQRARPAGSRRGSQGARGFPGSSSADSGRSEGRSADPVAAGSEGGTVEQAKEACLRLLAVRARSRAELAQRLAAKGYTPEVSERALDRLGEVGLIDDAAFAEQWVHSRHTFSGKGKQALAQELRRKGVAQSDAAAALDAISTDDEEARAAELVRRKLRSLPRELDRDKRIRRLVGMLARRGYDQSTAYRVVKAELAERGIEGDLDGSID
ncbi:recombination regulator RecX [Nocardia niwae]|uniref:Regulatory protein RecX n=2 Tax=Nocardia niwae TaxID=626084 RepID=A0ABV2XC18_9NOCA